MHELFVWNFGLKITMCDKFSQYLMGIFFVKITPNQPYYLQNCLGMLATTKKKEILLFTF